MAEKVRLTPEILLSFSDIYLQSTFDEPVPTPKAHLEWWWYCCLDHRYVAIAAPRGHAKSTAITLTFVLASVCLRAKRHVLVISDTVEQANLHLGNIAVQLRENEDLRKTFGILKLVKDNEGEIIIQWVDKSYTRIAAHGSGQKIRGVNWRGIRPDLVIGDDLENDELVMNEERREKFRRWFWRTVVPLVGKTGELRLAGTILHEDSLLARFMPDQLGDKLVKMEPLRVTTTKQRAFRSALYRAHPDEDDYSVLLWPEQYSEERLRLIQQGYIDDGFPEGYAQEYLNNPMAGDSAYFNSDDLIPILPEENHSASKSPEEFYIGVDLAISEKSRRAYTVFIVFGYGTDKVLRCREVIRRRMDTLEILDTFFDLHIKYRRKSARGTPPVFLIEDENIRKSIGPVLDQRMEDDDEYLTYEVMPPIHDKELRGRSAQARTRQHRVEFDHEADWWPTLKHELMTFPRSTYCDQVDAFAWVGHYVNNMLDPPTPQEIEDEEWEDKYQQASRHWHRRNRFTGYRV